MFAVTLIKAFLCISFGYLLGLIFGVHGLDTFDIEESTKRKIRKVIAKWNKAVFGA